MKTEVFLGLDLGGTGAKAGAFDRSGTMLGFGRCSYTPCISEPGHVEIPVNDIYTAALRAVREALKKHHPHVLALAISSQGQTFVSLDANDTPLHPAIVWYDNRASEQAKRIKDVLCRKGEKIPAIQTISTAAKIMWLKEHFPTMMQNARRYLLLPDYFTYRLTGKAITDPNTASSTALFAEDAERYDCQALAATGIEENQLAEILPSGSPVAHVLPQLADEWGLSPETLVVTGTNDQYAGALGAGNCHPGILTETTGTCLALVTLTKQLPEPLPDGLLGGRFPIQCYQFALAYSKTAGVVVEWFKRECCHNIRFSELNKIAEHVPVGCHGLTMLPHFDGMISPVPNPHVRGAFCYLTLQHTRQDMYRAILESLTFSLLDSIEFLQQQGFQMNVIRSIGGGAKNDMWLQMKADALGRPIEKPMITEAAVLGAAMLAASGYGEFSSLAEASAALYQKQGVFNPNKANHQAYKEPYQRYKNLFKILS